MMQGTLVDREQPDLADVQTMVADNPLFAGLNEHHFSALRQAVPGTRLVQSGETLLEEGSPPGELFFILSGRFEVRKRQAGNAESHVIGSLGAGQCIGEVALLDNAPRSASIVAAEDSRVLVVDLKTLESHGGQLGEAATRMKINLGAQIAARLRNANDSTIAHLTARLAEEQLRVEMGKFISRMLFGVSLYVFGLGLTSALSDVVPDSAIITVPISIVLAFFFFRTIKTSPYPIAAYGLTLKDWRGKALEAVLWSLPVLAAILAAKVWMVANIPAFAGQPVFDFARSQGLDASQAIMFAVLYCAFTPVQELCTRGGIQCSLTMFLKGRFGAVEAIILSNLMFSLTHLHLSLVTAAMVFPVGLFWGWLFHRQRSLVGVSVSHALIGVVGLFVVGFGRLF